MYNKYIGFIVNESKLSSDERDVTFQEFGAWAAILHTTNIEISFVFLGNTAALNNITEI